jgi:uncharacterized protein YbjT (DUF2867 family)
MDRKLILLAAANDSVTGRLVVEHARRRDHYVQLLPALTDDARVDGADAIVLVPRRGEPERDARAVIAAAQRAAPHPHLLLVSSFGVGYGPAHPFNRTMRVLPSMAAAERALRSSGLPYTIVRATWLTDDPAGAHALTLSQRAHVDGMLARADLATTLVAAIEQPAARNRTFALFNEPGSAGRSWARSFARLAPDSPMVAA